MAKCYRPQVELRHLRYFVAVAEELHFRRAAERLHISQPPLSEQINHLEEELGTQLLERGRARKVFLTAAGAVLLTEARKILIQIDKAAEVVQRTGRGEVGMMSVGMAPAMAYGVVPQILRRFRSEVPAVRLQLTETVTSQQEKAILDGTLDIGFCYGAVQSNTLAIECIFREPLILAVPTHHPIANVSRVRLGDVKGELLSIPRSVSPGLYDIIWQTCREAGLAPESIQEITQFTNAIGLVSVGMGVALVPSSMAALKRDGVSYVELEGRTPLVETLIVRSPGEPYPAMRRLIELAKACASTIEHHQSEE